METNRLIQDYFNEGEGHYEKQDFIRAIPFFLKIDSLSKDLDIINSTTIAAMLRRAEISKLSFTPATTDLAYNLLHEALVISKESPSKANI